MIARLTSVAVLLLAVVAAFLVTGASDGGDGRTYKIEFDNAFGIPRAAT